MFNALLLNSWPDVVLVNKDGGSIPSLNKIYQ